MMFYNSLLVEIKNLLILYKCAHGVNLFICNELFAISKFTIFMVLHAFVIVMTLFLEK
jgi:hypothetical protein